MTKQPGLFDAEEKKPILTMKGEQAWWECLKDCYAGVNGTIHSFIKGNQYVQLRGDKLTLSDENGCYHVLSEWEPHFKFHSIRPWKPIKNTGLI
jgi:hypothetical protein